MSHRVLFLIAALNEEKNIPHVLRDVRTHFPTAEVLVVDGLSRDKTVEVALSHGAHVITVAKYFGIGGAVEAGLLFALKNGYDSVIRIDADGQHDAGEVRRLYDTFVSEEIDLLIGSRYLGSADYRTNLIRTVAIGLIAFLMRLCYGVRVQDCTSGNHFYSRRVIERFASDINFDYSEVLMICLSHKAGFKIKEEFINMQERREGVSTFTLKNAFNYVFRNVVDVIFTMPLRIRRA